MTRQTLKRWLPWLAGIAGLIAIIWLFRPEDFGPTLAAVGLPGVGGWVLLTLLARLVLVETTVAPLRALGFRMSRGDVFWTGWVRTLANQILPLSGVVAYANVIRSRVDISWSELAALAQPQFVLALAALGIVGLGATACNLELLQTRALPIAIVYLAIFGVAVAITTGAAWFIGLLPAALSSRAAETAGALHKLARPPNLVAKIILFHALAIVLRGGRIWILFAAAGVALDWRELLLVLVVAESMMLVNVTPGGLGIREVFVLGGSALVGIPAPVAASVALADRLFVIAMTALLTGPALVYLRKAR